MNRGQARHKGQTLATTPGTAQLNTRNRERRQQLNSCGRSERIYYGLSRVKGSQVVVALMETSAIVEHELVTVRDAGNGYEEAVKWKLTGKSQCTAIQHPARWRSTANQGYLEERENSEQLSGVICSEATVRMRGAAHANCRRRTSAHL